MSSKETNSGLLSKVAKFVRNPTTNWTDLDKQDPEPDAGYSKQALKEMIERKRQNDFVRRREFDQLRKLRSRDPSGGNPDLAGRPSYFQSSLPSNPDERAMTIKKIDEIEAQMSNQWWQGKGDGARPTAKPATSGNAAGAPRAAETADDPAYAPTRLTPMSSSDRSLSGSETSDFPPTQDNSTFGVHSGPQDVRPEAEESRPAETAAHPVAHAGKPAAVAANEPFAVELGDGPTDPDLEEAAIRFANGDDEGAESGLVEALKNTDAPRDQAHTWALALFDLYRATGQHDRFEAAAVEYSRRFGRTAPEWFSMPERLGKSGGESGITTVPSRLMEEPLWRCPAQLDRTAVDELQLAIANAAQPWFLDWTALAELHDDGIAALAEVFAQWCATPVELRFAGARNLEKVLRSAAPSGDRSVDQANWKLRMDALRIMRLQDDFELVALDFCVTFEVSPPSWQEARCNYQGANLAAGGQGDPSDAAHAESPTELAAPPEPGDFRQAATVPMGLETVVAAVVELSGEIVGEATDEIERLEAARQDSSRLVVSCANLVRVDFSAAGSILNWVAMREAEGCHLQFRDAHWLVAAFFHVVGINEHARVVLRNQ